MEPTRVTRNRQDGAAEGGVAALTPRQREVACLLAEGHTPAAIAARLSLSPHTVHEHIRQLYDRLDCHHRGELIAHVLRADLCDMPAK